MRVTTRQMSAGAPAPVSGADPGAVSYVWSTDRDRAARDALITHHIPLARRLAARYRSSHDGNEDLVQVAMVGLIGAVDRFDPERATSFASFAIPTILGELKRHFRNTGWAAHVPRRAQELSLRVEQASRELMTQSGRAPTVPALAQYLELDIDTVIEGLEAGGAHHATSLDAPAGRAASGEDPSRWGDDRRGRRTAPARRDPHLAGRRHSAPAAAGTRGPQPAGQRRAAPGRDRRAPGLLADAGVAVAAARRRPPARRRRDLGLTGSPRGRGTVKVKRFFRRPP